jgi:hypothetical protein
MEHDFKQESVINTSNTNGNLVSTSASSLDNTEYASSGMTAEDEAEMEAINAINSRAAYLGRCRIYYFTILNLNTFLKLYTFHTQ